MAAILCSRCKEPYPPSGLPYCCPKCGGVFDFDGPPDFDPASISKQERGLWRYRHSFDLFSGAPLVTLGEGDTPLVWDQYQGVRVGYKMESLNPTGSYKDRGSAVLLSQILARGARSAVEDSSGNAGASFAAYAARAGIEARVFVPEAASGPKRLQIEAYGAELVCVPGPRSAAAAAVLKDVEAGAVYASHAYMPFGLSGIATIAYEIYESLGQAPGTVIAPVGHGGLFLGLMRGFTALHHKALIKTLPYYVGVQAKSCAPVWSAFWAGFNASGSPADPLMEGHTVAEGVKVRNPVRAEAILEEISPSAGQFLAIEEDAILPACSELARRGLYVEPTSALAWCALQKVIGSVPEPIILILTGSGLKYLPAK